MITKKKVRETLASDLRAASLRATIQRVAVLGHLRAAPGHGSAEDVHAALSRDYPGLSRTTVYNILGELRVAGLAHAITIKEDEHLWDAGAGNHHHFLCKTCGRIEDIDVPCPYLKGMIGKVGRVDEIHGYFKGECSSCVKKERRKVK